MESALEKENALNLSSVGSEDTACEIIKPLAISTFLPELKFGSNRPYETADFEEYKQISEQNFKALNNIFCKLHEYFPITCEDWSHGKTDLIVSVLILCSEHMHDELWTTKCTHQYAQTLLNNLLIYLGEHTVTNLLLTSKKDLVHLLLITLRPKLLKDTWKNYPAAVLSYKWLLYHIQSPNLARRFSDLLPTALIILDDHENKNKLLALNCLQHIVGNVTAAYLEDCNGGHVIYEAIKPLIYFRDAEILASLVSFFIVLFNKTEQRPFTVNPSWSRFDDVLSVWLPAMEMEQRISLRTVYIDVLPPFLDAMGLPCIRWSRKLINIFSEYMREGTTCEKSLRALELFMEICWPRLVHHVSDIFVILVRVVIDIPDLQDICDLCEIKVLVKKCLGILSKSAPEEFNKIFESVKLNDELCSVITCILEM